MYICVWGVYVGVCVVCEHICAIKCRGWRSMSGDPFLFVLHLFWKQHLIESASHWLIRMISQWPSVSFCLSYTSQHLAMWQQTCCLQAQILACLLEIWTLVAMLVWQGLCWQSCLPSLNLWKSSIHPYPNTCHIHCRLFLVKESASLATY